jgi:vesicular inhibitory amino acid transporter
MTEVWGWDESTRPALRPVRTFLPRRGVDLGEMTPAGRSQVTQATRDEVTPLLGAPPTSTQATVGSYGGLDACISGESHVSADRSLLRRKSSATLKKSYNYGGQSTYGQTVGNVI